MRSISPLEETSSGAAVVKRRSKGKGKETVEVTIQKRGENPKENARVRDRPALRDGIPFTRGTPTGKRASGKENQPTSFAYKKVIVHKGMPVTGIHLSVSFIEKRNCKKVCI